ncbi:MAG: hypothetical protein IPF54_25190 [Draconibacterium sp.]|nr:hypothetical protein [Draconibacterium sp.]
MSFSFSANNAKASGNLNLLYKGLKFDLMDKQTGETTALKEQVKSLIANIIVIESNPMPDEEVRQGIIDYKRDPERYIFGNFFRALLTGIKSTVTKTNSSKKLKK